MRMQGVRRQCGGNAALHRRFHFFTLVYFVCKKNNCRNGSRSPNKDLFALQCEPPPPLRSHRFSLEAHFGFPTVLCYVVDCNPYILSIVHCQLSARDGPTLRRRFGTPNEAQQRRRPRHCRRRHRRRPRWTPPMPPVAPSSRSVVDGGVVCGCHRSPEGACDRCVGEGVYRRDVSLACVCMYPCLVFVSRGAEAGGLGQPRRNPVPSGFHSGRGIRA